MEKLKDIRSILITPLAAILALVVIDLYVYNCLYIYLYLALAVAILVIITILSIVIFDTKESLIDSLNNGKSFELEVNKIEYNRYFAKRYAHYMKILNGIE